MFSPDFENWVRLANTLGTYLTLLFIVWIWHGNRQTNIYLRRRESREKREALEMLKVEMDNGRPSESDTSH